MTNQPNLDTQHFRRVLSRNVKLPLLAGLVGAAIFVALIVYLLNVIGWVEHTDQVTRSATEAQRLSVDMESSMRGFLITGEPRFLEPYEAAQGRIGSHLSELRGLVADNPAQVSRLDRIIGTQKTWNAYADELIARRRAGENFLEGVRTGRGKALSDAIRSDYASFVGTEQTLRFQRNTDANRTSIAVVGAYLLFSLSLTALLAYFGRRQLLQLSASYQAALDQQATAAEVLRQQAMTRAAQAELGAELVGQLSPRDLGRKVLAFFSRHLGSPVGAVYVREADGSLVRAASYGFSAEAEAVAQRIGPDEGLVAQAAAERRLMLVEPVDSAYLRVNSGLGSASPRAALLMPVLHDDVVMGVVELGLLRTPDDAAARLLDSTAGTIGSAIAAARYREQLQDALSETQQLNEELQVQQEELRTANEELEEQSHVLRESQASLENQQAELEQINNQLSERTETLDLRNAALQRAQLDLEERAAELQRASRYKSEFLANMSHELRTPLNSALILSKLLGDNPQGNLSAEQVKFAESIYASGNDLLVLINDILDIAKVEAGKLEISPEDVPLVVLTESLQMTFAPLAADKRLAFEIEVTD
ncbi:MAG: GAF domain-containing protein, partial [Comamonadaceae bacterium]